MRSRYWCFTLNNPNEDETETIKNTYDSHANYLILGFEIGESGTRHIQGYIELSRRTRFDKVKSLLGARVHLERRLGSACQAAQYCKKDGNFLEYGEIEGTSAGKRTDLDSFREALTTGSKRKKDLVDEHFGVFMRYGRSFNDAISTFSEVRTWKTDTYVLWGRSGSGKTSFVYSTENDIYSHSGERWFDGYDRNHVVLFDDLRDSVFPIAYLLKLLDRYPFRVPVKGGYTNWVPRRIYITTNVDPFTWYGNVDDETRQALFRRFEAVQHFQ